MRASAFALLCLLALPAGADDAPAPLGPGDHDLELRHGGLDRYYLVHVPPQVEAARRAAAGGTAAVTSALPVVLAFHGGGGNAEGMRKVAVGFDRLADREGFVLVYPGGTGRFDRRLLTWNAGPCCGWSKEHDVDDVGFTLAVLVDLARRVPLDRTRVYATGMSNGGMMSHRLGAELGDRLAAIAPVGGAILPTAAPAGGRPVPMMHVHSVDDPRALYSGGLGPPFPLTDHRVDHPAINDVLAWWLARNGCGLEPRCDAPRKGAGASATHTATRFTYPPRTDAGAEVVHWRLTGAGHVWPGGDPMLPARLVGPASDVVDVNAEMWAFFARFTRKDAPPLE